MSTKQELREKRSVAYAEFASAGWRAMEMHMQHGERSKEYLDARARVDKLRVVFGACADEFNAAPDDD